MSTENDFLSRWSRRKLTPEPDKDPVVELPVDPPPAPDDDRPEDEILAELGLKHPDALEPGDDIKGFMQVAVPDRLRRMALRQLFRTRPDLAVLDGLVEYGEDFTDSATVIANLQTAYRVGKGMFTDEELAEREADQSAEGEANPEDDPPHEDSSVSGEPVADDPETAMADGPAMDDDAVAAELPPSAAPDDPMEDEALEMGATRRRMTFRFDDA